MIFGCMTKTHRTSGFGKPSKCRTNRPKCFFGNESQSEKKGAKPLPPPGMGIRHLVKGSGLGGTPEVIGGMYIQLERVLWR